MSPGPAKLRLTPEVLARMREEAAAARARTEAAWTRAASEPPPPEATRAEPERGLRSLALGLAAFAAFLPAALLADGGGSVVAPPAALKNAIVVALLTLIPALVAARTERAPEAEDAPASRFARRFSPLAVGILLVLSIPMAWVRWPVVEAALIAQALIGLYLHVPRARACHTFALLWGALASTTLDERAVFGLLVALALVVLAAVLDRSLDVRVALGFHAPGPSLAPLLGAAGVVVGVFLALFGASFWLVRDLELRLPRVEHARLPQRLADKGPSTADLFVALAVIVLMLGAYHLVFGRLERKNEATDLEEEESLPAPSIEPLAPEAPLDTTGWPAGPRRTLVERYLAHLSRLERLGSPRAPAQAPLELAESVGERAPGVLDRARRLARAFHEARYSPAAVSPEAAADVASEAGAIEGSLEGRALPAQAAGRASSPPEPRDA